MSIHGTPPSARGPELGARSGVPGLYSPTLAMPSLSKLPPAPPTPSPADLTRFLVGCHGLTGLATSDLQPMAAHMKWTRHPRGTRLFSSEVPDRLAPLRFVVHGRAMWHSSHSRDQQGAWTLTRGASLGMGSVNDWAVHEGLEEAWPETNLPRISCWAMSPLWTLDLAPEHFSEVLLASDGERVRHRLMAAYPSVVVAPKIIEAMRATPQFERVSSADLYTLLQAAPTLTLEPSPDQDPDQDQDQKVPPADMFIPTGEFAEWGGGGSQRALYYVLHGQLYVPLADEVVSVSAGQLGGTALFPSDAALGTLSAPMALTTTKVVVISRSAVGRLAQLSPGFGRSLGPLDQAVRVNP